MQKVGPFLSRFSGVGVVSFLTYCGEYMSLIVVVAFLSDKLTVTFNLGTYGYGLIAPISGAYLVASGLVSVPVGHLCDEYGRRKFTMLGSTLGAVALLSLTLLDQVANLLGFALGMGAALILLGVGHGTYTASTLAYTGDVAGEDELGKPYGLVELAEFAAYAFGPILGAILAFEYGRTLTFLLSGLILLAAVGVAAFFMPESGGSNARARSATWNDFAQVLRNPVVGVTMVTTAVAALGFTAFFIYVPLYAYSLRTSIPQFAYLYTAFASIMAGTGVVAMLPLGAIEDKVKRRMPILVLGLVLGSLSLLAVFFSASIVSLVFASLTFGISLAMTRVSQLVILGERSEVENRAAVMGTNHAMEHTGYGIGALVGGGLVAFYGLGETFRYLAILLFLAALGFFIYALVKKVQ